MMELDARHQCSRGSTGHHVHLRAFMLDWPWTTAAKEESMAELKKPPQTASAHKRRHKFNHKREVRPQVLTRANRLVAWAASLVVIAFLAILAVHAMLARW